VAKHLQDSTFEPQHLSLIAWALAALQCKPTVLLDQIETQAIKQLPDFSMQNCANIVWAFAKLNYRASGELLPAVSEAVCRPGKLDHCKPVEASDLAFGVAVLGDAEVNRELMELLAARASASQQLEQFSSRQIITLIWSFARLKAAPPREPLDAWVAKLQGAHEARPLLIQDQRNLRRALDALGEPTAWLDQPVEDDVAESDVDEPKLSPELLAARARRDAES